MASVIPAIKPAQTGTQALQHHEPQDVTLLSADRHPNADFAGAKDGRS
jgi:hypothetical protein